MNDSLVSNRRPKNLNSGTTSICTPSNVSSGSKCNFLEQRKEGLKYTRNPFILEYFLEKETDI